MIRHLIRSMLGYRGPTAWQMEMERRCKELRQFGMSDDAIKSLKDLSSQVATRTLYSTRHWFDALSGELLVRLVQMRYDASMGIPLDR